MVNYIKFIKSKAKLRQQLEDAIKGGGNNRWTMPRKHLKEMEQLENELLEKGFNQGYAYKECKS